MSAQLGDGAVEIRCPDTNQVIPPSNYNISTDIALSPYTGKVFDLSDLRETQEQEAEDQALLRAPMKGLDVHQDKDQLEISVLARSLGQDITLFIALCVWAGFIVLITRFSLPLGTGELIAVVCYSLFGLFLITGGINYLFGINKLVVTNESLEAHRGLRFLRRRKIINRDSIQCVFVGLASQGNSDNAPKYRLCIKADTLTCVFSGISKPRLDYAGAILRTEIGSQHMTPWSRTGDLALTLRCPDTDTVIPSDQYDVNADSVNSPFTGKAWKLSRLFQWQQRHDADLAITSHAPDSVRVIREQDQITLRINSAELANPYSIWVLAVVWNSALVIIFLMNRTSWSSTLSGGTPELIMFFAAVIGLILLWKSFTRSFGSLAVILHEDQCSIVNHSGLLSSKQRFDGDRINSIVVQGWRNMSYEKLTPSGGYVVINVISDYGDYFFSKTRDMEVADYIAAMMRLNLGSLNRLSEHAEIPPSGRDDLAHTSQDNELIPPPHEEC